MTRITSAWRIVEQGTHEELLKKKGVYEMLYTTQLSVQEAGKA